MTQFQYYKFLRHYIFKSIPRRPKLDACFGNVVSFLCDKLANSYRSDFPQGMRAKSVFLFLLQVATHIVNDLATRKAIIPAMHGGYIENKILWTRGSFFFPPLDYPIGFPYVMYKSCFW
jgi:hypothetical protein